VTNPIWEEFEPKEPFQTWDQAPYLPWEGTLAPKVCEEEAQE